MALARTQSAQPFLAERQVRPASLFNWSFKMPDGSRFTDQRWNQLRQSAEMFVTSLVDDPPEGRTPVRRETLRTTFGHMRVLVRWMAADGVWAFAELDQDALDRFLAMLQRRSGKVGEKLSLSTAQSYIGTIRSFYMQRTKLEDAPLIAPRRVCQTGNGHWTPSGRYSYTPDDVAVPLIAGAIAMLGEPADRLLDLRDHAEHLRDKALNDYRGRTLGWHLARAIAATPVPYADRYPSSNWPLRRLTFLLDRLEDACFVVIAYLVGARASEILGLEVGCLERHASGTEVDAHVYLVGRITKTSASEHGNIHRWLAPEPVQRAVHVLERLSAPLRGLSADQNLWLHQSGWGRSPLPTKLPIGRLHPEIVNDRLNRRFAPFLDLPAHDGQSWHLSTYQGRKTFSRFVGRRDRTGLTALQRHLGHIHRAMTDRSYVGTDFELSELIDEQTAEETRDALETLLIAPQVAGKAGMMISERSPFRGRTRSGDVAAYITQILAETDMRLGVCDWGYCLYRRETSACLGSEREPNPVLRTQSTCVTCANFAVTHKHRPVREARLQRNTAMLDRGDLDPESQALANVRVGECRRILDQLDERLADGLQG